MGQMYFPDEAAYGNASYGYNSTPNPTAEISKVWLEQNYRGADLNAHYTNGLLIHIDFSVNNYQDRICKVQAFFYEEDYYRDIKGKTVMYRSNSGTAFVGSTTKSYGNHSSWQNYKLFMPYNELVCNISTILSFILVVRDDKNGEMARVGGKFHFIKY